MPNDTGSGGLGGTSEAEQSNIEELSSPPARIIYEVVRRQGEEELERPIGSLFWSGLAAGIAITASVMMEAAISKALPAGMAARELIADFGYCLGFLIVILGKMQLFTEQTIVVVLPNMAAPSWRKLGVTARLWAIVFGANMLGTCGAAAVNHYVGLMGPALTGSMLEVSERLLGHTPLEMLLLGVPAGFLIASVAWIRAGVSGGEFWVVVALSYAIAVCGFAHVVAGSSEAFLLMFAGKVGLGQVLGGMIVPALVGNVIGGTGLFALLAHAQVSREL